MASLVPFPKFSALSAVGVPLSGGLLYTYEAGTVTPLDTYTTSVGNVANSNPVELDASGLANVWVNPAKLYKFILKTAAGVTLWTVDNIGFTADGMSWINSGAGAVRETVQAALRALPKNPDSYGADNTGVADSTAAIQAAVNAGNAIEFTAGGIYKVGATITITDALNIMGNGATIICEGQYHFAATSVDNITVENIRFEHSGDGEKFFYLRNCNYLRFNNVIFDAALASSAYLNGFVLQLEGCNFVWVDNCELYDSNNNIFLNGYGSVTTTLSATEAEGQTVISVTTTAGMAVGGYGLVRLDNLSFFHATIVAIGAGTVTLSASLPGQASSGNAFIYTQPCDNVFVTNSYFEHREYGDFYNNPTGVYQGYCRNLVVDNCTFKNIFHGGSEVYAKGYAVYEGDGAADHLLVTNCRNIITDSTTKKHGFVLSSMVHDAQIVNNQMFVMESASVNCEFAVCSASENVTVSNNFMYGVGGSGIIVAGSSVNPLTRSVNIESNTLHNSTVVNAALIRVGVTTYGTTSAIVSDNLIQICRGGGIFINNSDFSTVSNNIVIDINTDNVAYVPGTNEQVVSGISFVSATNGLVTDNRVENTLSIGGHAKYGIASATSATAHSIDIRDDNLCLRMETAPYLNPFTASARPAQTWFSTGYYVAYMPPAAGGPSGEYCVDQRYTVVNGTEAGGQTVITVGDSTGMATNDKIAILLDTGDYHYTYITNIAGADLTINTALPSQASNANEVITSRYKQTANIAA